VVGLTADLLGTLHLSAHIGPVNGITGNLAGGTGIEIGGALVEIGGAPVEII
jgi:hypothetical protein